MRKISISRWLTLFVLFVFLFNACSTSTQDVTVTKVSPNQTSVPPTATVAPTETPAQTATEAVAATVAPTETPAPTDTATAAATETVTPFDLEKKTCTVDDSPAILAAVQEKFHFPAGIQDGTLITNKDTSPTYSGPMEVAFQCTMTGMMKDPTGKEGDVSVEGLHLVVFHIKVGGRMPFYNLFMMTWA